MRNSLIGEIKTFCYSRITCIAVILILIAPIAFQVFSCNHAVKSIAECDRFISEQKALEEQEDIEVDLSYVYDDMEGIFVTYHPSNSLNNSLAILLGLGILGFPALFAIYIGKEYKSNSIKPKIVYHSLIRVLFSKCIVTLGVITSFLIVYTILSRVVMEICWRDKFAERLSDSGLSITPISYSLTDIAKQYLIVLGVLFFYSLICMVVATLFKSSVAGLIAMVTINYVSLPTRYSPHSILFKIICSYFYQSNASPFGFRMTKYALLTNQQGLLLVLIYTVLLLVTVFVVGKYQRN